MTAAAAPAASSGANLMALSDDAFLWHWGEMTIEEREALPDDVRADCIARKRKLSPHIEASVRNAERTLGSIPDRSEPQQAAPLPGFPVAAIWEGFTPPPYLAKRLLGPSELTVLFGQSGHFKSVVAIDLALCVATGTEFHGNRTRRVGVLYVAGEGHTGIRKRLRAWLLEHGYDATSEQPALFITSAGADLIGKPDQLRATVDHAAGVLGLPIDLVVIDTLAASFGMGDENHVRDMTLAIHGARTAAPDAAVLLVHHSGHGQERERGSYSLVAAADVRIQASYDEISKTIELKWMKQKDDERPEPFVFAWKSVPLDWQDADGEELSSVVLERLHSAGIPPRSPRSTGMGKNQDIAVRSLRTLYAQIRKNLAERGEDPGRALVLTDGWRHDLEKRGLNRQRFHEVLNDLQQRRLIVIDGPHVRFVDVLP